MMLVVNAFSLSVIGIYSSALINVNGNVFCHDGKGTQICIFMGFFFSFVWSREGE